MMGEVEVEVVAAVVAVEVVAVEVVAVEVEVAGGRHLRRLPHRLAHRSRVVVVHDPLGGVLLAVGPVLLEPLRQTREQLEVLAFEARELLETFGLEPGHTGGRGRRR